MTAETPADAPATLATPLALAFAWTEAVGEMTRASIGAWSALASSYGQASEAYAALFRSAINLEGFETLALANSADGLLRRELHALEGGTDRLVNAAEDALAGLARGPIPSLPE